MRIAIIDYGSGNLRSVAKAFERVAPESAHVHVTASPQALADATHLVLPGVGAFGDCMRGLSALPGLREALERARAGGKPLLGICVGMQMLLSEGHEHGAHPGLGWIPGTVERLAAPGLKIPHMGWNELVVRAAHPLLAGIETGHHAYFVHSYHAVCAQPAHVLAQVDYGGPVTAAIAHENIMGTQFHPEKSQETGLRLLGNFLALA